MKNISTICILFMTICLPNTLFGSIHTAMITGKVADEITDIPVEGALVRIIEENLVTVTNELGLFQFTDLQPGTEYSIELRYIGYAGKTIRMIAAEHVAQPVVIALEPTPVSLENVEVSGAIKNQHNAVSSIDIMLRPMNSAQDMLRLVPGLFIAQHAGGGKAEQIFLRGFDIDHGTDIRLTVDGMPVNMVSHAHGQGYADLHFVIPETIESFDFTKGPYDAQAGDFATAGSVDFRTKDHLEENQFQLGHGQFHTTRALLMLRLFDHTKRAASSYLAAEYYTSDGPFLSPQDLNRINVFGKYKAMLSERLVIELSASAFQSQWNASGQIPARAVDQGLIDRFGAIDDREGGNTGRTNTQLTLTKYDQANASFRHMFYFTTYHFELFSNFTFFLEDSINGDMIRQYEDRNVFGYTGDYRRDHRLFGVKGEFMSGFGFRADDVTDNTLSRVYAREMLLSYLALGDVKQKNVFGFVRNSAQLNEKLALTTALRLDWFHFGYADKLEAGVPLATEQDAIVTGHIKLDYTINRNMAMYVHAGKGFHSNDARVVVAQNAFRTLPGAYGTDVGLRWKPNDDLLLQGTAWMLYLEQEFVYVGDAAIVEPSGETMRRGVEMSMRYAPYPWLFFDADINFTHARALHAPADEEFIPLAPGLTSMGGINLITKNGWTGSIRYRYMHDRPANASGSIVAEGYFVNDVTIRYKRSWYAVAMEIQNVCNVAWNEAQFETESRLQWEPAPVSELHFTPGTPFFLKMSFSTFF